MINEQIIYGKSQFLSNNEQKNWKNKSNVEDVYKNRKICYNIGVIN